MKYIQPRIYIYIYIERERERERTYRRMPKLKKKLCKSILFSKKQEMNILMSKKT